MSVTESLGRRPARIGLLTLLVVGWGAITAGIAADLTLLTISGAVVVAVVNLFFAKSLLEIGSRVRSFAKVGRQANATTEKLSRLLTEVERLKSRSLALTEEIAILDRGLAGSRTDQIAQRAAIESIDGDVRALTDELRRRQEAGDAGLRVLARDLEEVSRRLAGLASSHETTRSALTATRGLTDKLAVQTRSRVASRERLLAVARTDTEAPLLSIAIPSFDRPGPLNELLESVASEVASCPPGLVEVCVTDDASPDPEAIETALAFAEKYGYASFRTQEVNVGIERNVLASGRQCRGEYLLLIGNDDVLLPGALTVIIGDIDAFGVSVLLYGKKRINRDGSPRPDVVGSTPIDLEEGATHLFPTLVDAARPQGLLSTLGFVGPIVVRTKPFLAVDPSPYLDLTMYAPTFALVEAFSNEPLLYHNVATILHRTSSQREKEAEALGRREHEFMIGGSRRLARYYGTSLAAALQRLVDRGAIDHAMLSDMPEQLMSDLSLIDWIEANRNLDPRVDEALDAAVVDDARRFFTAMMAPGATR